MVDGAVPPYRAPTPRAAERIVWPDAFGTRFMVFIDVEEEFDWRAPLDAANRGTGAMAAFADAHRRFADHGVALVCMVDHPIATDPAAIDILTQALEDGRTTIGAQLHAWVTPPLVDRTPGDTYAGNLPRALEAAKIDELTGALHRAFGRAPLIFRSGRYGIGPATLDLLAERGYRIDSSVRARYDYRADRGPDFRGVGNAAYRIGPIVEIPLTTVYTGAARGGGERLYRALGRVPAARGLAARTRLLRRIALTPEDMPIDDALAAVSVAAEQGERLLTFSFHSPSLMPGHTPYVRTPDDLVRFWAWWDRMFAHLAALGIAPVTLDGLLAAMI